MNASFPRRSRVVLLLIAIVAALAAVAQMPASAQEPPQIHVRTNEDLIGGENFTGDATVTVEIFASSLSATPLFSGSVATEGDGSWGLGPETHGEDLGPGTYIEATDDTTSVSKELTVVPLTFDVLHPVTNTASGTAEAGETVHVEIFQGPNEFFGQDVADENGSWSVTFVGDITGGDGSATVFDGDFDRTETWGGVPKFSASALTDRVGSSDAGPPFTHAGHCGANFTANDTVTLKIFDANDVLLFSGTIPTGERGSFNVGVETHNVNLKPGMLVQVTDDTDGITKELTVESVTFDTLDPRRDIAAGKAPPGVPLSLVIGVPGGTGGPETDPIVLGEISPANAKGNWSFGPEPGVDITKDMTGAVCAMDADGDSSHAVSSSKLKGK